MRRTASVQCLCLLTTLLATTFAPRSAAAADTVRKLSGFTPAWMDTTADPCQDFYQYTCGGWLKNNPIPEEQPYWSRFHEIFTNNMATVSSILDKAAANSPSRKPSEQKIGDYFASCLDEAGTEARGTAPLQPDLAAVEAVQDRGALGRAVARLHLAGADALFKLAAVQDFKDSSRVIAEVGPGGMGLPSRDYYFDSDPKSAEIRDKYVAHVRKMFELLGDAPDKAEARARAAVRLETALAQGSLTPVEQREPANLYHLMKRADLARLAPSFDWDAYLAAVGAPAFTEVNIAVPKFLEGLEAQLRAAPLADWRSYLRWRLVTAAAPALPAAFVNEDFDFFRKTLSGAERIAPRWQRCFRALDADLGEALGQVYVDAAFSEESRRRIESMTAGLVRALDRDLRDLDWMGEATKKEARAKLAKMEVKIGYPQPWRDYGSLRIVRGDDLGNRQRSRAFELRRQLAKIGKPMDRREWTVTPATVNAFYTAQTNDISFPAGVLQPPFFDAQLDAAANFGAIGALIGHEITHGFDDEGRQFDAAGNLRDWWTAEDAKRFQERASCLEKQYSQYVVTADVKLNGKLTLGENTADLGGLRIAYMAFEEMPGRPTAKIDGFTPEQRVFLGYGQAWCQDFRPEAARRLVLSDPHATGRYRVNGVVANMPEFRQAFGCKTGQPMAPENICRVW